MDMIADVREFMEASKQLPCEVTPALLNLRARMLAEEFGEFLIAWSRRDIVGIADGLVDVAYVSVGTLLALGLSEGAPSSALCATDFMCTVGSCIECLVLGEHALRLRDCLPAVGEHLHDFLIDALHEASAFASSLNLPFEALWAEVHRSNMAKAPFEMDAHGKIIKPPGWSPPDIAGVLRAHGVEVP